MILNISCQNELLYFQFLSLSHLENATSVLKFLFLFLQATSHLFIIKSRTMTSMLANKTNCIRAQAWPVRSCGKYGNLSQELRAIAALLYVEKILPMSCDHWRRGWARQEHKAEAIMGLESRIHRIFTQF